MGKYTVQANNGLISTLLCVKQWLRGGMLTLNAVVWIQIMLNTQVAQIWQLSGKIPKNSTNLFWPIDCELKLCEIAEELKISEGSVFTILHEHLSLRKLCLKWVRRLLTVDQKQQCVDDL